ncbi:MAG: biosynthetic arginine decarboxylase [Kiritimatiellae bacterium]|nr:biosynthetic arginine decarboxylase [Kiritimatiellia bacterium]
MTKPELLSRWTVEQSAELYGVRNWGAGYFDIAPDGSVLVRPSGNGSQVTLRLPDIVRGLHDRGLATPLLLRFDDILRSRIAQLHSSFERAIRGADYQGSYRGVYPVKVNQQQRVVEAISAFGRPWKYGLEAGSKAELIAALAYIEDPEALIVCNGYKDEEFIDLALHARKMGLNAVIVMDMPTELSLVLDRAERLGVKPALGIRFKLTTRGGGHWTDSAGDRSMFGFTAPQLMEVLSQLRARDRLDTLCMLHFHIGSQIPNIRSIQAACREATRVYTGLVSEGAPMGYLNVGGGLAVDYDGSHSNYSSSSNYSLDEYTADVVEVVGSVCGDAGVPHPVLVSESGRAVTAHHSVLVFNVLTVSQFVSSDDSGALPDDAPEALENLYEIYRGLTPKNLQESYHDAVFYRDEIRDQFEHGLGSLRHRAMAEKMFWNIVVRVAEATVDRKHVPEELEGIQNALADVYHANFSVFQSLPDIWAIEQIFPVMPIHRLNEYPTRTGILSDITCDCDGKITRFADLKDVSPVLRLHPLRPGEPYMIGVFLAGAYQETLGDLHNLFGDTNVVNIRVGEAGEVEYVAEFDGDTVADVLSYVEYNPAQLVERYRAIAERAVRQGLITPQERREIMDHYEAGLRGYTYFEE